MMMTNRSLLLIIEYKCCNTKAEKTPVTQDSSGSVTSRSLGLPRRQSHLEDIQSDSDSTTVDTTLDRKESAAKTR